MARLPFFIAKRYLLAQHRQHAVGLLSRVAVGAVAVATLSLFIVLSGFTGLKDYALAFTSVFDSDLVVYPKTGKSFYCSPEQLSHLQGLSGVLAATRMVEEKVFIKYKEQSRVAVLRGVDAAYTQVTPIDTLIYTGGWFSDERFEVVPGYAVAVDLALAARDYANLIELYVPIPGANVMAASSPDQVFRSERVVASGIYQVNDQINDRFVFTSLETAQSLFYWPEDHVSSLGLKTSAVDLPRLIDEINTVFQQDVVVKTRVEQNAALYKMLNTENLFTYLFISLIAAIAIFNLTGTLIMLVLEKKANLKTLHTLGQTIQQIRATFFASGILMCVAGLVLGLVLGFMTVLGQSIYGWVLITESLPYPVTFTLTNFLLVSGTIMGLGTLASFFGAQRVTGRLLN